jgi:CheY-like chemotaxis protein
MRRAGDRARALVGRLSGLATLETQEPERIDAGDLLSGLRARLERVASGRRLHVSVAGDTPGAWAAPDVLEAAVVDLVDNAARATADGGVVGVTAGPGRGGGLEISVRDDGAGMEPVIAARAFEPFFTTRRGRWGLGLPMVHAAISAVGGHVALETHRGVGTVVRLTLPPMEAWPAGASIDPAAVTADSRARWTALVVDDDAARCLVSKRILEEAGLRVLAASHPEVALLLAGSEADGVDLAVLPPRLPDLEPERLAGELRAMHPALQVLCLRADGDEGRVSWADGAVPPGVDRAALQAAARALLVEVS